MKTDKTMTGRVSLIGVLTALALIFSYVELLIPFNFGIPGVKLGLANMVIVVGIYILPLRQVVMLDLMKILAVSFLFGNGMTLIYSMAGGFLSLGAMVAAKHTEKLSPVGISVIGGVFHNIGQLIVAVIILENLRIAYYFSVLAVAGVLTGLLLGLTSDRIIHILKKNTGYI